MRVGEVVWAGAALVVLTSMTATAQEAATAETGGYGAFADVAVADLVGTKVVSGGGEDVGEVESLITATSGDVMAVLGVGGFLGFGEHDVAVPLTELAPAEGAVLLQSLDRAALEAMPEYGGDGAALAMDVTVSGTPVAPAVENPVEVPAVPEG